jgi:DNA-binding NarL/FixJ family response regulator
VRTPWKEVATRKVSGKPKVTHRRGPLIAPPPSYVSLPVLVHTVLTQHEAHSWAFKMGANEVISKNSPLEEVVAAIRRLGGGNRAEPNSRDDKRRR